MIISTKLTAERLEEIKNHPISYDEDILSSIFIVGQR